MFGNTFNILCSLHWIQGPGPENGKPPFPHKSFSTPTRARGFTGHSVLIGIIQLLSHIWLFVITCMAKEQASLSYNILCSFLKLMSIESCPLSPMQSHHLIPLIPLLMSSIFPSISVSSNELDIHIRWPKSWSFNFSSVLPLNIALPLPKQNSCFQPYNKIEHWWSLVE